MSDRQQPLISDPTLDPASLVNRACIDLIRRVRLGEPISVENYVRDFPALASRDHLLDLIDAEICVLAELGQTPTLESYAKRFPEYKSTIRELLQLAHSFPASATVPMPKRIGGYRILRLLGRGAMGAVYEARQLSLDRTVAIKTIRDRLAANPASLARFVREAYSAAQLSHHNVVQIYDFDQDSGRYFFSMEWVRGGPLSSLVRANGPLDPRLAAGYILQAARGLQFAHSHGMVHRDIKPANLLLSNEGVVKLADLGLVKIPDQADIHPRNLSGISGALKSGSNVTMMGTAVGTPAYMAPEQAFDAASVDHRADIYSLGCTFFFLLAGHPPFQGSESSAVMTMHAQSPIPDIEAINPRVPIEVARIIRHMMAKRVGDRYESLDGCIDELESFLGLGDEGKFSPTMSQADRWEELSKRFASVDLPYRFDDLILLSSFATAILITCLTGWLGSAWLLTGAAFFIAGLTTILALSGVRSPVFCNIRTWFFSLSPIGFAVFGLALILCLNVVVFTGVWPGVLLGSLVGVAAATAYQLVIVVPARNRTDVVVKEAERFIRNLRIDGADEPGLQSFAARYAGRSWQRLFEQLFGYKALLQTRSVLRKDPSFSSPVEGSWRDMACRKLADQAAANERRAAKARLAAVERQGLESEGFSVGEARTRSWAMASATIDSPQFLPNLSTQPTESFQQKRDRIKAMLADARSGKYRVERAKYSILKRLMGGPTRLLLGCCLLAVFAIWGSQQGLLDSVKDVESLKQITSGNARLDELGVAIRDAAVIANQSTTAPRSNPSLVNPWSLGVAGLLLALSAFVSGWRMSVPAAVATLVILYGPPFGLPGFSDVIAPWVTSAVIGMVIYIPGILFGETEAG